MKFDICSRWSGAILFSLETESLRLAVEAGIKSGADLSSADLCCANLSSANLSGADLSGADLRGADLSGANLSSAKLRGAKLYAANLSSANLSGADLSGADLYAANLSSAKLRGAKLLPIRDDIWSVLSSAPAEVEGLRAAIAEGRIDGSTYQGECCCLVGTLANERHCKYDEIPSLKPDSSRPAECFFMAIKPGDTPENSEAAKLALQWVDEWLANTKAAFAIRGGE